MRWNLISGVKGRKNIKKEKYYKFFNWYAVDSFEERVNTWIAENANEIEVSKQLCEVDGKGMITIVIEYTLRGSD